MPDKKDTVKLEMPREQAVILADIVRSLAQCLEPPTNIQYADEYFPHKWKEIVYTTLQKMKLPQIKNLSMKT